MNINNNNNKSNEIAVIGLGFRFPITENKTENNSNLLWNNLINKFENIVSTKERWNENFNSLGEISCGVASLLPLDEWKSFDPLFFGINPSEVSTIDPQQRVLLKCIWESLEDAKIDPIELRGSNTSVFIGASTNDYRQLNWDVDQIFPNYFGSSFHSIANRASYCFDFKGQSVTLDTACSSSMNAIQFGYKSIIDGTSNISIVGGVNLILDPMISKSFTYLNMTSKSGRCKAFDAEADGFVRGEGAGVVVLKSLKQAIKDGNNIYCIINGTNSNVDSNGLSDKLNFYSPSSESQAENIKLALKSTNGIVSPSDIDYMEAHGTGTPTGDPIELEGISMVFKDHKSSSSPLLIGSIKSNIGHCEAASGIASLIKCCLMFKNQCFVPNSNFKTPNPKIKFQDWKLKVVTEPIPFNSNKTVSMAINNFGITGSNCCLILSQFKPENYNLINLPTSTSSDSNKSKLLIPFSANSIESLNQYESMIKATSSTRSNQEFIEFVNQQIQFKSKSLYQRSVIIASNWNEFNNNLNKIKTSNPKSSNILLSKGKVNPITIFVFCGQGSQYNTMALELYNNNEIFKQSMDLLDGKLSKYYGYSVIEKLRSINDNDMITTHDPITAQPAICMVQASLVQLYKHWGIEPSFIIGHSLGEVTAAYCSGMMDLDTFCYAVYYRSLYQATTNGCGKMLSINCSADEFTSLFSSRYPSIEIACFNSPSSIVIAGNEKQLIEISLELKDKGIFTAMLGSLSSFHTSSQACIKDQVLNLNIEPSIPTIPTFSTTTTNLYTKFTSEYLYQNIKSPVYFSQTIENVYKHIESNQLGNEIVFIEIAPHQTLSFYLKQMIPKNSNYFKNGGEFISIYSPLHKKKNDTQEVYQMISNLYCQNQYNINFKCQIRDSYNLGISSQLPLYQWDDQKYWKSSFNIQNKLTNGSPIDHLGNLNYESPLIKSYQSFIDISREPFQYLKGHIVKGKFYFPGCGYIDNLLKIYPLQDLTIDYLEFKTPLIFTDGINQCLQTNISQIGKSDYRIQFHFKDNKTNQWVNCSNGNFQLINHDTINDKKLLNIQNILNDQCNLTKLSKKELYEYIKMKTGLTYNGWFQAVEQLYLGDGCSLSVVSIKQPFTTTSFFNTSILDCCLHGMIGLLDEKCQIVFEKIEGFKYYSSNIPNDHDHHQNIYVYSKLKSRIGESYTASIIATLTDGTILFEIENATCKSLIPIKDSLSIEYPTNELFTSYHQSIESLITIPVSTTAQSSSTNDENQLASEIIKECIKPLINEKMVFRILEFGGITCTLSNIVLDKINQLLEQFSNYEIDIEFTWTDVSPSFIPDQVKTELLSTTINTKNDKFNINIIHKAIDICQPLINKQTSHYDIIIMSNILHSLKDINYGLIQIYDLLLPNGQLLFIEPINQIPWTNLLNDCNFEKVTISNNETSNFFLAQAQKPSLNNILSSLSNNDNNENNSIFIYGNENENLMNLFASPFKIISNINQFKDLIKLSIINDQSIIYFTKSINQLNLDNFKSITLEYIQINQILLEYELNNCKHVLLSLDSSTSNYLASSLIGSFRYFCEFPQLQLYSITFDSTSITTNNNNISKIINYLINPNNTIQNEFIIKNNQIYYERYKQELKLKNTFKSSSFEIGNDSGGSGENDNLLATLTPNLEYQLDSKQLELNENEIEVKVMATGINYKDYLVYACLVPPIIVNGKNDSNKQNLGYDFSGIVTRVGGVNKGSGDEKLKIGDQVYGIGYNATASHIIVDKKQVYFKPSNISHCEAASLPSIYLTNLYGIFNVGDLDIDENESILIHSATGGIGLSALEILKWKGHKAPIFATVGSKEKEQYLLNNYGDIITAIYSTNNKNYSNKIKEKLLEIGWKKQGVDLILNTLSSEFMDANFKTLTIKGRIVDLSITHLNYNEYTCNNKFKYNMGYHNIELMHINKSTISKLLKKLSIAIENQQLKLIPITQFSNSEIKEAIEYVNQRKHIGKIVVNHDTDIIKELMIKESNQSNYSVLKSNYQINNIGKNIIITGQSGIAFEILKWIIEYHGSNCIENIIILSKSSMKWELELLINKTKKLNKINFHFKSVDVGDSEAMNRVIDEILLDNPSIRNIETILHYAFTQISCKVNEINMNHLDISHGAKTIGAINLHNQSIKHDWKLMNFIMASSVSSIIGSSDDCSYISANCVLDNLSKYRKSIGLPSICINYGLLGSAGFVARNESVAAMLDGEGINPISTNKILGSLDLQIQNQNLSTNLVFCNFNFKNILNKNQSKYHHPLYLKFDYQINSNISNNNNGNNSEHQSSENGNDKINDLVLNKISELLSIDVSKINLDIKLNDYGVDSLFIVQLKNWIDKEISSNIISIQQLQNNTIKDLINIIIIATTSTTKTTKSSKQTNNNKTTSTSADDNSEFWKNEIKLDNSIINLINEKVKSVTMDKESIIKRMNKDMVVLLTGSTGFLGAYLLWHFIKLSNCSKIYCLIRNKSKSLNPMNEILNNLKNHKLYDEFIEKSILLKVQVIVGDLSKVQLGLSNQDYTEISNNVNLIVNSGANIDLKSTYKDIKQDNVNSIKELIKLSVTSSSSNDTIKCFANFSSFSVLLNLKFNQDFEESIILPSIESIDNFEKMGYIQSKIVSENLLMQASSLGIPSILLRPPFIFSNSNSGIGSVNDLILLMVQSCYAIGYYPNDINKNLLMAPVDWIADKIIKIITNENLWKVDISGSSSLGMNIFNINGEMTNCIEFFKHFETEFNCKGIEFNKWITIMEESKNRSCIKLKSFHNPKTFISENIILSNLSISNKTKSILESMNSYDNGWFISSKIIKNHINHIFKL